MAGIFLKIVNMSINAGWLVLVVLTARFLLKKAPKYVHCILWAFVAFRLVCPISFESAMSLLPSEKTFEPHIIFSESPKIDSGIEMVNHSVNTVLSNRFVTDVGASANPLQIWTEAAATVWIIGMVLVLLYSVIAYLRLKFKVSASISFESNCNMKNNIRLCDDIESPFVLGIVKPIIYLPSDLSETEQTFVIAHEQAHLKRGDHFWKPLGFIILAVYWFQPLIWIAYILLCRDIEMACDERVVRMMNGKERKEYSGALLACSVPRHMIAACPLAFGEVGVKQRVKNVLNYKKPAFWIMLVALVTGGVIAVCFLTNPKEKKEPRKKTTENITERSNHLERVEKADELPPVNDEANPTHWLYAEQEEDKVCVELIDWAATSNDDMTSYYIPDGELQEQLMELVAGTEKNWQSAAQLWKEKKKIGWAIVYNDKRFEACEDGYLYAYDAENDREYIGKHEEMCSIIAEELEEIYNYKPVDVTKIKDIIGAQITLNRMNEKGQYIAENIIEPEALQNFEEWFSNAECVPHGDTCVTGGIKMDLFLKNGEHVTMLLAEDDCTFMVVNGVHYNYCPEEYRNAGGWYSDNIFKYFKIISKYRSENP